MLTTRRLFHWAGLLLLLLAGGWFLSSTALHADDQQTQAPNGEQIVGGQAASPGEYPWQLYLEINQQYICGGSLINAEWVLTAAHCVMENGQVETNVVVTLGEHRLSQAEGAEQIRSATKVIVHPGYDSNAYDNDIALIQLNTPANLNSRVATIDLITSPGDDNLVSVGQVATVTGWGTTKENGSAADVLQEVSIPIVSNTTCDNAYGGGITNNMICAGLAAGGKDACQGDSGGPLIVPNGNGWKQAGIVSFGNGCAQPNFYGVYTRVSRYISWINTTIGTPSATATATATDLPTATSTQTATPTATPTASPTSPGTTGSNLLRNGDFEAGPNGDWSENSNTFGGQGSLILNRQQLSQFVDPLGQYSAELGSANAEQATLGQKITLPTGSQATLTFAYQIFSEETQCGDDQLLVRVNNSAIKTFGLCQTSQVDQWTTAEIDLSAYLGQTVQLQFFISTDDDLPSSFFLDNVQLTVPGVTATATPTEQPTPVASATPVLHNGDFEQGANGNWSESQGQGSSIKPVSQTDLLPSALTGNQVAWLRGGENGATSIAQTITIPNDPPVSLRYDYQILSKDRCDSNQLTVATAFQNATQLLCAFRQDRQWRQATVDLSPSIGQQVNLQMLMNSDPHLPSTVFIDNVAIASAHAPQLRLSATQVNFYVSAYGGAPAPQTLHILLGQSLTWSIDSPADNWLSVTPSTGTNNGTVTLTVNPGLLSNGLTTTSFQVRAGTQLIPVQVNATVGTNAPLQAPPDALQLTAQSSATGISLRWTATDKPNVTGYQITRKTPEATVLADQYQALTFHDQLPAVNLGQPICYQVAAIDNNGTAISQSNQACATAGRVQLWAPMVIVRPGTNLNLPINLVNAETLRIRNSDLVLRYDPALLTYQGVATTSLTALYSITAQITVMGELHLQLTPQNPSDPPQLAGAGALFVLDFQVNGANGATSVIDLRPSDGADSAVALWDLPGVSQPLSATVELQDGVVILDESGKYTPGDSNGDGAITQADVEQILALVTAQPAAYQAQLHALAPLFTQESSTDQAAAQVAGDLNGNGGLDAGDAVRILQLSQQRTQPNHQAQSATNQASPAVTVTLGFDTITAARGSVATSTFSGQNLADFAGGTFHIIYDPTSIEGVAAITKTLPGAILHFEDNQNGLVQVALAMSSAVNGDQALFQIGFKLRKNAPSNYQDLLVLADAQLYNHAGEDLLNSAASPLLARMSGAIIVEKSDNSLYLPVIQR